MTHVSLLRRLSKLGAQQQGAAAVELALVAPLLGLIILGTVDVAQALAARYELEQAAQRTTELALAKRPLNDLEKGYLEAEALSAQPTATVVVELHMECDGVPDPDYGAACSGKASRYVSVALQKAYTPIFNYGPFVAMLGGTNAGLAGVTMIGESTVQVQ